MVSTFRMCTGMLSRFSCVRLFRPYRLQFARLLCPWDSSGKNTGMGCHALLQGIFPTQGLNPSLPHCRQILYQLSHWGSPRTLEWVAYPFSSGSGIKWESPTLQVDSLVAELLGKPQKNLSP